MTCAFSALSFAELASSIPVSGSAYTYGYATMGELVAWIIGWDLILEYAVSVAAVAVGWGQYFNDLLDALFGFSLPDVAREPARARAASFNLPAVFIVLAVTALLCSACARARAPTRSWCASSSRSWSLFIVARRSPASTRGNLHAVQARRASTASSPPRR